MTSRLLSSLALLLIASAHALPHPLPVALMHGFASSAEKVQNLANWVSDTFDVAVYNLEIGTSSIKTSMPDQLTMLCNLIYSMPELSGGFDFIGMSQGGLLARGYVERCNRYPVRNLITLATPHGGTYEPGIPMSFAPRSAQGYWRDPTKIMKYIRECNYLPGLNTEIPGPAGQRENILSLANMVLVWSVNDGVINPHESGAFSFYDEDLKVVPIFDTEIYQKDTLGLKSLNESGRFHIYNTTCTHQDHKESHCYENQLYHIFERYLRIQN